MRRRSTWVAWALLTVWTASVVALVVLSVANGSFQQQPLADTVGLLLAFAAFTGVGRWSSPTGPATPSAGSSRPSACWR